MDEQVRFGDEVASEEETPEYAWHDGLLVNMATGEIVDTEHEERFEVDSIDAAEWVLSKMAEHEAAILAHQARAKALIDNLLAMQHEDERILEGLHRRFDLELHAFARAELARQGWRTKTLKTAYGQIGFRDVPARLKVIDQEAALAWAKEHIPEKVRVKESVTDTDVIEAWEDLAGGPERNGLFIEGVPPSERVTIKTNVSSERRESHE